jgi:hypothetical protein
MSRPGTIRVRRRPTAHALQHVAVLLQRLVPQIDQDPMQGVMVRFGHAVPPCDDGRWMLACERADQ